MSNRPDLLIEPQLPEYLIDPDDRASLAKMREALMARAQWEEIKDAAKRHKLPMDRFIETLSPDEIKLFGEHAYIRALVTISKIRGLTGRVEMSVAYGILKKNIHRTIGEYESVQAFLEDKLDPDDPQGSSTYEAKFLLELIQSLESMGKAGFADKIFSNKFVYGKLVSQIPALHRKQRALAAAQNMFKDLEKELEGKQNKVRKERSDARMRGEPLKPYDEELKKLEQKKAKAGEDQKPITQRLQADLRATTAAAIELAGSDIPRADVVEKLPLVAEVYLRKEGFKPEEVSPDYRKNGSRPDPKAKALSIHLNGETIFVLKANARQSALVTKFLSEMFDVSLGELDEGIALLSKHKKQGV